MTTTKRPDHRLKQYYTMIVTLGGGWGDGAGGDTLKEAVESAYHQAMQRHVRYVTITRQGGRYKLGQQRIVCEVAGYNGKVYMARCGVLGKFKWQGVLPDDPATYVELTGRYETPADYSI